jgi:SWIRM domain
MSFGLSTPKLGSAASNKASASLFESPLLLATTTTTTTGGGGAMTQQASSINSSTSISAPPVFAPTVVSSAIFGRQVSVRRSLGAPLDISDAEGFELLSSAERNLCSILRLFPKLYLSIKETLLAAHARLGGCLKRAQARSLIKIDVNKTSKIYDFFVASGWISPFPGAHSSPINEHVAL